MGHPARGLGPDQVGLRPPTAAGKPYSAGDRAERNRKKLGEESPQRRQRSGLLRHGPGLIACTKRLRVTNRGQVRAPPGRARCVETPRRTYPPLNQPVSSATAEGLQGTGPLRILGEWTRNTRFPPPPSSSSRPAILLHGNIPGDQPGTRSPRLLARSALGSSATGHTQNRKAMLLGSPSWIAGAGSGLASFSRPSSDQRRSAPINPVRGHGRPSRLEAETPGGEHPRPPISCRWARRQIRRIRFDRSTVLSHSEPTAAQKARLSASKLVPLSPQRNTKAWLRGASKDDPRRGLRFRSRIHPQSGLHLHSATQHLGQAPHPGQPFSTLSSLPGPLPRLGE